MNPAHEPTDDSRRYVEELAARGIPQADICKVVGISEPTLRLHYRQELDTGTTRANHAVAGALFRKATEGEGSAAVTAAIFWLKTRAGWKETNVNELVGKDGGPLPTNIAITFVRPDAQPDDVAT